MSGRQRNCTIDLMRFVMTLAVVMVHIVTGCMKSEMTILKGGTIAVEFFFMLSGLLLAASADRADHTQPVWQATWKTMKGKFCGLYPMWLLALTMRFAVEIARERLPLSKAVRLVEQSTSGFLMFTQMGLLDSAAVIRYSWYIPVLLLCSLLLYPFLFVRRRTFTYVAAPVIAVFCGTYLFGTTGSLFTRDVWLGFTWSATVRGLFSMCLGVICYEASLWLRQYAAGRLTRAGRTLFSLLEAALLVYIFYYVLRFLYPEILLNVTLCFAAFLILAFAGVTWSAEVIRGRAWAWLGRFSLAVYLGQSVPALLMPPLYGTMNRWLFILLYFAFTFAVAFVLWYGAKGLTHLYRWTKAALKRLAFGPDAA